MSLHPDLEPDTRPAAPPTDPATVVAGTAFLVLVYPDGPAAGRRYPVTEPLLIGRADDCQVRIEDGSVSRQHALVGLTPNGFVVEDLGSTNGIFVNDRPARGRTPLTDGDTLRVGNCLFRFMAGGDAEEEYQEEMRRLAVRDVLTGVPNRRALTEFLDRETARGRESARPLSVVLFDVDHFGRVNDALGQVGGDQVLRGVAARVWPTVRGEDLLARYVGGTFALALVGTDHAGAVRVADRVRRLVGGRPFEPLGRPLRVTVSAGVASSGGDWEFGPAALLGLADDRMHQAKRAGRDRVFADAGPVVPGVDGLPS
jgi:diguanylate cyclase (GGDEF)-like protein